MIFIRRSSFICSLFLVTCLLLVVSSNTEEDLYILLGVSRSASAREIKKAYRKKALDTHPDKNKDVSPEVAAAAFHKVVHAFEILSDSSSRQRYDRTGRTDTNGGGGNPHQQRNARNFQWTFRWNTSGQRREKPKLKDRFDVKESQSRILHIVSLEQLETIITNDDGVLERNLLICFYTPPLEKLVMEEMVYPWPFAGMSSQGIWWEDLLQTTVVRYHNSNDLTEFFGIPRGGDLKEPKFVFGKRGQVFKDKNAWSSRFETNDREKFDKWVWQQLEVPIKFVNNHDHPVELYWIHERVGHVKGIIEPGEIRDHTTMLSHEWFVRDARTDTRPDSPNRNKLSEETCLFRTKILSDVQVEYVIPKRNCYDLSGHCPFWNRVRSIGFDRYGRPIPRQQRECDRNPNFMHEICRRTCGKCQLDSDKEETDENDRKNNSESKGSDEL